jgi:hypothetical protein
MLRCAVTGGAASAAVAAALLLTGGAPSAAQKPSDETTRQGTVFQLPYAGTLRWRCDEQKRFVTRLSIPRRGATVYATLDVDGARVWTRRRVDPGQRPSSPPTLRTQAWKIRYHHKPGTVVTRVRLRFREDRLGGCRVSRALIDVRRPR